MNTTETINALGNLERLYSTLLLDCISMTNWDNQQQASLHKKLLFEQICRSTFALFSKIDGIPSSCKHLQLSNNSFIDAMLIKNLVDQLPDEVPLDNTMEIEDNGGFEDFLDEEEVGGDFTQQQKTSNLITKQIQGSSSSSSGTNLIKSYNDQISATASSTSIYTEQPASMTHEEWIKKEQESFFGPELSETKKSINRNDNSFFDELQGEDERIEYSMARRRRRRRYRYPVDLDTSSQIEDDFELLLKTFTPSATPGVTSSCITSNKSSCTQGKSQVKNDSNLATIDSMKPPQLKSKVDEVTPNNQFGSKKNQQSNPRVSNQQQQSQPQPVLTTPISGESIAEKQRVIKYFCEHYDVGKRNKIEVIYDIVKAFKYSYSSVYLLISNQADLNTKDLKPEFLPKTLRTPHSTSGTTAMKPKQNNGVTSTLPTGKSEYASSTLPSYQKKVVNNVVPAQNSSNGNKSKSNNITQFMQQTIMNGGKQVNFEHNIY